MMFRRLVTVMGMPRSGTSWLSQIFDSCPETRFRLSPLFSYEFKNKLDLTSSKSDWETVLHGAYRSSNEFMDQTARRRAGHYPEFRDKQQDPAVLVLKDTRFHNLTERMLDLFPDARVIYIVRHPAGAINSWLRAPREFPAHADPKQEWRTGACRKSGVGEYWGFDDWVKVTRMYLRLHHERPDQVAIQHYERLVADTANQTQELFDFCQLSNSAQTQAFLSECHGRHEANDYAVFKSPAVAELWRTQLDQTIIDAILSELRGTDLEAFI